MAPRDQGSCNLDRNLDGLYLQSYLRSFPEGPLMLGNDAPTPTPPVPVAPPPSPAYQANGGLARAPGTAAPKPYGGTLLTSPEGDATASVAKKSLLGQ